MEEDEIRHSKQRDEHCDECLLVIKNGASMEIALYPYCLQPQRRRILLPESTDVVYVTPYSWLDKRIKRAFPSPISMYPIVNGVRIWDRMFEREA